MGITHLTYYRPVTGWCLTNALMRFFFSFSERIEGLQGFFFLGIEMDMNNERGTKFWMDRWCTNVPSYMFFPDFFLWPKTPLGQFLQTGRIIVGISRGRSWIRWGILPRGRNLCSSTRTIYQGLGINLVVPGIPKGFFCLEAFIVSLMRVHCDAYLLRQSGGLKCRLNLGSSSGL